MPFADRFGLCARIRLASLFVALGTLTLVAFQAAAIEQSAAHGATIALNLLALVLLLYTAQTSAARISRMTEAMRALAEGDADITVPFQDRRDEMGAMARAMEVFRSDAGRVRDSELRAARAEQRLREGIEALPGGFALWGPDEKLVACNRHYRTMRARPAPADMFMPGSDLETELRRAVAAGTIETEGDSEAWIQDELQRHRSASDNPIKQYPDGRWALTHRARASDGSTVVLRTDLTAEKMADTRLQDAIESINEGFALYDADDRLVMCNEEFRRLGVSDGSLLQPGLTFEQIMRKRVAAGLTPPGVDPDQWVEQMLAAHRNVGSTYEREAADGTWLLVSIRRTTEGGTVIVRTDITAQKRAERRMMDAVNAFNGTFSLYDTDGRIVLCNDALRRRVAPDIPGEKVIGTTFEELIRKRLARGAYDDGLARRDPEAYLQKRLAQFREPPNEAISYRLNDGTWTAVYLQRTPSGETVGFSVDVTALKQTEQRLIDAIANINDGFALYDSQDRLILCNETFRTQSLADTDLIRPGVPIESLLESVWERAAGPMGHPREEWIRTKLARFKEAQGTYETQFTNGDWFLVTERRTSEGGTVIIRTNITQQKRGEQQLRDAIEALDEGFALFDADDKLVMCNSRYQETRDIPVYFVRPGMRYEEILRKGIEIGAFNPGDDREAWVEARLTEQCNPSGHRQRRTPDGRTLMISKLRTSGGGTVNLRRDISAQVRAEQRLRDAIESINEGFALYDAEDRLVMCNRRYRDRTFDASYLQPGVSFEQHVRHIAEVKGTPGDEPVEDFVARRVREHHAAAGSVEVSADNGTAFLVTDRRTADGGIVTIRTDITAQKQAEQRLRDAIENIPDGFVLYDAEDRIVVSNPRLLELFPRSRDSLSPGVTFAEQVRAAVRSGDILDAVGREDQWIQERVAHHQEPQSAWETRLSNGVWVRATERRTREGGVVGIWTDITELKRREFELRGQEIQLRESEARFRNLVEGSVQGILIDRDGKPLFANQALADMFGFETAEDILTLPSLDELYAESERGRIRRYRADRLHGRPAPTGYAFEGLRRDGASMWGENHARRISWKGEPAVQSTIVDITERKRSEAEIAARTTQLRESESRYRAVFRNAGVGMARTGTDGRYLEVNETFAAILDYKVEEMLGLGYFDITPAESRDTDLKDARLLLDGEIPILSKEKQYLDKHGNSVWVQINSVPVRDEDGAIQYVITVIQDIRERKRQEQELLQAQKMDAIGQLTGGIAHDFNNLLTIIVGNLILLQEDLEQIDAAPEEVIATLDDALSAGRQGSELVKRLLAFARRQPLRPEPVNVGKLVGDLLPILQRTLGATIEIECRCDKQLGLVTLDPAGMDSALLNLAINARDAMPDGGNLTIETRLASDEERARSPGLQQRDYAVVSVRDTGIGMTQETLERAFEPFFTSKEAAKGSGLGLSMVYGLARQLGGDVQIDTRIGGGTEVRMLLPVSAPGAQPRAVTTRDIAAPPPGTESVLVVEDDPRVRRLAVTCLSSLGYDVADAADATDALARLESSGGVDLLFSDIIMPGEMTGMALADAVRGRWPDTRVLLATGYTEALEEAAESETPPIIYKPYDKLDLAIVVRRTLDGEPGPEAD